MSLACMCPSGHQTCVHELFFLEFQKDLFPNDGTFDTTSKSAVNQDRDDMS